MNPDSNMPVATCVDRWGYKWDEVNEDLGYRPLLQTFEFSNYGQAKLWANEFEEKARKERDERVARTRGHRG